MKLIRQIFLGVAVAGGVMFAIGVLGGGPQWWQPGAVTASVALAVGLGAIPVLRGYQFTAWIAAAVIAAMIFPGAFLKWGDFDLHNKWLFLVMVQAVMFGMGTQMRLRDFAGVARSPRGVLVGIVCHFSVMPLIGLGLIKLFRFPGEIAAGVILVGSCSSGLASNVMAYLAGANLALSVTVTAVTTMIAPLMTPLWMKLLAGTLVEVSFLGMMTDIVKIVIVPIGAALLHDYLKNAAPSRRRRVFRVAAAAAIWLVVLPLGGWSWLVRELAPTALIIAGLVGYFAAAVVIGVLYHALVARYSRLERLMPVASMVGIVYAVTMTTSAGRDNLLKVGALLFLASALHNLAGYFFGYWLSRAAKLDKNSARSVAFEVGLQNGAMASGLAAAMGKLGTVGLAPAIFSPWMNISGSVLANYWKRKSVPSADRRPVGFEVAEADPAPPASR